MVDMSVVCWDGTMVVRLAVCLVVCLDKVMVVS